MTLVPEMLKMPWYLVPLDATIRAAFKALNGLRRAGRWVRNWDPCG